MRIPVVSLNDDGRVVVVSEQEGGKFENEPVNKEKSKLTVSSIPFSLTCILHKNYILADPTTEEESIMENLVTVVLNLSGQLVSLYKPGGPVLAHTSAVQVSFHCQVYILMEPKNSNLMNLTRVNQVCCHVNHSCTFHDEVTQVSLFKSMLIEVI